MYNKKLKKKPILDTLLKMIREQLNRKPEEAQHNLRLVETTAICVLCQLVARSQLTQQEREKVIRALEKIKIEAISSPLGIDPDVLFPNDLFQAIAPPPFRPRQKNKKTKK